MRYRVLQYVVRLFHVKLICGDGRIMFILLSVLCLKLSGHYA